MNDAPHFAGAMHAWVTITSAGELSLVGATLAGSNVHAALAGFNRANIERLRELAVAHGRALRQPVYFVQFNGAAILESYPVAES
jgi:hypothetical protein